MKITIEGDPKEIAALVRGLQERQTGSVEITNAYTNNLIVEDEDVPSIQWGSFAYYDGSIR